MSQPDDWRIPVRQAATRPRRTVRADDFLGLLGDALGPAKLACDDGETYAVKGLHTGRVVVNDHVIALFGRAMAAPIPEVCLVDVPAELIRLHPEMEMRKFRPGLAHGSRWTPGCFDVKGSPEKLFQYAHAPENRAPFARLAILYGVGEAQDRQWLYEDAPPHRVHSVDHGHFFSGAKWCADTFEPGRGTQPDWFITKYAACSPAEIRAAAELVRGIDNALIAQIVAAPPDEWELVEEHRCDMAFYLATRRDAMLDHIRLYY